MRRTVLTMALLAFVISCKDSKSETPQDQDLIVKGDNVIVPKAILSSERLKPKQFPNRNIVTVLFLPVQFRLFPIIMQKLQVLFREG